MQALELLINILSWVAIISGSIFIIIGAYGAYKAPGFWSRLQSVSLIESLGAFLVLIGLGLQSGFTFITIKIVIIGIFLFITGPTSTHALANAAFSSGVRPEQKLESD
tara:strand:+ start:437 stop:760 length:324 start_codon:yes stop_codon:yes gene_type:complete